MGVPADSVQDGARGSGAPHGVVVEIAAETMPPGLPVSVQAAAQCERSDRFNNASEPGADQACATATLHAPAVHRPHRRAEDGFFLKMSYLFHM